MAPRLTARNAGSRLDAEQREELVRALPIRLRAQVRFDEPLSAHTTWRIGGPAEVWAEPRDVRQLAALLRVLRARRIPVRVLGAGSNVLVADQGASGAVVCLAGELEDWIREREGARTLRLRVGAGARLTAMARRLSGEGWSGLEFAVGIPSTMGGAVVMNAGAHGREMKDVVRWAELVVPNGAVRRIPARQLEFGYRHVRLPAGAIVTRVGVALHRDEPAAIRARVRDHLDYRKSTQPLTEPSCGSVFVNPPAGSAGRCIEEAGLKGRRIGGAEVSRVHANFIVNVGHARAADVVALVGELRATVKARRGIELIPEVRPFGDFPGGDPW